MSGCARSNGSFKLFPFLAHCGICRDCEHQGAGISFMNTGYQKYLDSEHWENLRLARLAQSRGLCLLCEFRAIQPQVHHTTYGPTLWTVSKRSLKPLCSECHSFAHAIADLHKSNTIGMTPREKWTFIRQKAIMLWSNKTRLPMLSAKPNRIVALAESTFQFNHKQI